jgi:hypothetical protein
MALSARIKELEDSIRPAEVIISLSQHACESDEAIRRRVRQVIGHPTREQNVVVLVVTLQAFGVECPPGPHSHPEDAKV